MEVFLHIFTNLYNFLYPLVNLLLPISRNCSISTFSNWFRNMKVVIMSSPSPSLPTQANLWLLSYHCRSVPLLQVHSILPIIGPSQAKLQIISGVPFWVNVNFIDVPNQIMEYKWLCFAMVLYYRENTIRPANGEWYFYFSIWW